ncbi:MAG: YncE family protein, partial [Bacteroidetes bacterium]|nr:YncE family protein [Bacteroidota bacterium]
MKSKHFPALLIILTVLLSGCGDGRSFGQSVLKLDKEIVLPNVKGRIDHLDIDVQDQVVFVAALGNNTVEVADLKTGK